MGNGAASELDWRAIVRDAPSLFLLLAPDLTILGASDAYLRGTMTRREEIVGRPLFDVFPDNPDDPEATGERNLRRSLEQVIERLAPHSMAIQQYDIRRPPEEGGGFEVRYWSPSNWPVLDDDGELHCVIHHVEDVTELVQLRDAGSELELELIARTDRLHAVIGPAQQAADEYHRALRDYNRLMRHRLANPLTAITGGIATLRELDLVVDRETRMQILDAMGEVAGKLEEAIVHPESTDDVERSELNAVPDVRDHAVDQLLELDAVKAQLVFREINHHMLAQLREQSEARTIEFFCECWSSHCTATVPMPLRDYCAIHARHDQFVIRPGHELPSVEEVVDRSDGRWVVRTFPAALERARQEGDRPT